MEIPDDYSAYKREEELSGDAQIDHCSRQGKTSSINIHGPSFNGKADGTESSKNTDTSI